ncbi:hypothetical protein ANN_24254 [Periplaneta americana]|uniref:Uncharacterized protein n=1 Tax=Periplaneta americana TaxID=6978 RepID=A0ABQ8S2Y2_PERAM|nr:hypothetical protein ANN_24254 [Periplaneta americana]
MDKWKRPRHRNGLMQMATWNVRSLLQPGASRDLEQVLVKYKVDILAVQEIRWRTMEVVKLKEYTLFNSGSKENRRGDIEEQDVTWFMWKSDQSERIHKVLEEGCTTELVGYICSIISQFIEHCYIKRHQAQCYRNVREDVVKSSFRCQAKWTLPKILLVWHKMKFKVPNCNSHRYNSTIIWNFSPHLMTKFHVGAVKRKVWNAVKQRKRQVTRADDFAKAYNSSEDSNVKVQSVSSTEVVHRNNELNTKGIIKNVKTVEGISQVHCIRANKETFTTSILTDEQGLNEF